MNRIDTAVIMAAGIGSRFGQRTEMIPKGFIPFRGIPMVLRSIETLIRAGVSRIIIGTGYHKEYYDFLEKIFPQVTTVFSPLFAETNSMMTLYCCRNEIAGQPFLLLESDIIYQPQAIEALMADPASDIMLITPVTKFQDQYYVECDSAGNLSACSTDASALTPAGELVGIHRLSPRFFRQMCADFESHLPADNRLGYEYEILRTACRPDFSMKVLSLPGLQWYEIDDEADLQYAESHINID